MRPNFSEFTYGYALTQELVTAGGFGIRALPVFPTQYEEGGAGGGYDVMLQTPGLPIFLQFKVADRMVGHTASEAQTGHFTPPYYRMRIHGSRHSDQHELLLELEVSDQTVFYASSAFESLSDLNHHYQNHTIRSQSLWVSPSQIGTFNDQGDHYVAFQIRGNWIVRSEPFEGVGSIDFSGASSRMLSRIEKEGDRLMRRGHVEDLASTVYKIAAQARDAHPTDIDRTKQFLSDRHPLEQIAFVSAVYLDTMFLIARAQ